MRADRDAALHRMERLSRMRDYDVAPNEPDPRGWTVVSRDGRAMGEVRDLLVDTDRMAATYLDVALNRRRFHLRDEEDARVLVPVERAHQAGKRVLVEEITCGWFDEVRAARETDQCEFWDRWWHREPESCEVAAEEVVVNRADEEPPLGRR